MCSFHYKGYFKTSIALGVLGTLCMGTYRVPIGCAHIMCNNLQSTSYDVILCPIHNFLTIDHTLSFYVSLHFSLR